MILRLEDVATESRQEILDQAAATPSGSTERQPDACDPVRPTGRGAAAPCSCALYHLT